MTRMPLPVFPAIGTRVRVATGCIELDEETAIPRTTLTWVSGDPVLEDGVWYIPVVACGRIAAGLVKEVGNDA
jgi:hypothetical protein